MKLPPKQKLLAIIAGLVLLAVLIVALLIAPQLTRLTSLEAEIQGAQAEADVARALLEQRQGIKARSSETETRRLRLANQLPVTPELASFIIELQDVINESGLQFSILSPSLPADSGLGFNTIGLTLTISGEWSDVVDFTQRLRRVVRQIRIVGFNVSQFEAPEATEATPTPGVPEPPQLVEVTMDIEIYSLAPAPPAAGTPPAQ